MTYRVAVRRGDFAVEVEGPDQNFVTAQLEKFWTPKEPTAAPVAAAEPPMTQNSNPTPTRKASLYELYQQVKPTQKQQEVAVIAFYLENYVEPSLEYWRAADVLSRWNETRARNKPGNINGTIAQSGYFLRGLESGQWQLSNTGLNWLRERLGLDE